MARKPNGQWAKGSNNYTDGCPPENLPAEPRMLLREVWRQVRTREGLFKALMKMAEDPKKGAAFFALSADYLEGSPKKTVEHQVREQPRFVIPARPAALTPPPEEPVA